MGWLASSHHSGDADLRYLAVIGIMRRHKDATEKGGLPGCEARLIPRTVPEVRRLLTRLIWTANHPADFVLSWSQWKRKHQARAKESHYQRRLSLPSPVVRL